MPSDDFDLTQRLTLVALAAFSAAWVTALGAAVGSFLNVVVYRMPRGMSLVRPRSRCPACGASIRPGDNLPVIGWLRLRGRCRDCGSPISSRYPLVEAAVGILFLGLAHFELFSGGANLPGGPPRAAGLSFVLWHLNPGLVGLSLYHAALLATLLCLALIAYDGFPPPRRLVFVAAVIGLCVPLFLRVHPVATFPAGRLPAAWDPLWKVWGVSVYVRPATLIARVIGVVVGAVVGFAVALAAPGGARRRSDQVGAVTVGALIGLFLGPQAAVSCGLAAAGPVLVSAVASRLVGRSLSVTALFAAAAPVQILFWRETMRVEWWPGPAGWEVLRRVGWPEAGFVVTSLGAAVVVTGVVCWVAGRVAGRGPIGSAAVEQPAESVVTETTAP